MNNCRSQLEQGLDALALQLDAAQIDSLLNFIQLIVKWNKAYNLTAIRDPTEMVACHLLDSVAILPYLRAPRIADIGTGAGLPGIPLAICHPDWHFTLLDSNSKKTRFVQQAALELKLKNVSVVHSRVELFKPETLFSTVICRAFAAMPDIWQTTAHLLAADGLLLAMKGKQPDQELAELNIAYRIAPLNVPGIDADRCLVLLEKSHHG